jgi:hypothetical protein
MMSEEKCCPEFVPKPWDEKELKWENALFVKDHVTCLFHIPLNFGSKMVKHVAAIEAANAKPSDADFIVISNNDTMWGMDIYIKATKEVPGVQMASINGTFLSKVFEGSYKDTPQWVNQMKHYVTTKGHEIKDLFFYYTTCPKCARKYGKNYVVLLAKTS